MTTLFSESSGQNLSSPPWILLLLHPATIYWQILLLEIYLYYNHFLPPLSQKHTIFHMEYGNSTPSGFPVFLSFLKSIYNSLTDPWKYESGCIILFVLHIRKDFPISPWIPLAFSHSEPAPACHFTPCSSLHIYLPSLLDFIWYHALCLFLCSSSASLSRLFWTCQTYFQL